MMNIIFKKQSDKNCLKPARRAFTLIEMLVAVVLILVMMTLFAQVFQIAAETMSTQKGVAENDQRSRTLSTIVRNDLQNRTFTKLAPWGANEALSGDEAERQGYWYYSENSLDDQTDDVLIFTIRLDQNDQRLFGKATQLGAATDINQPEGDDGQIEYLAGIDNLLPNNQGASRSAVVAYFLRNGNLYRRVLLIREEFSAVGTWPVILNDTTDYPLANNFRTDFDYSAHYNSGVRIHRDSPNVPTTGIYLDNSSGAGISLGEPIYRYGHLFKIGDANHGNPLEFIEDPATVFTFIGRYTHQETSDPNFLYPGALPDWNTDTVSDYPMDRANTLLKVSANGIVTFNDGAVDTEFDGARVGEDILLSHVHEFDVKIWDEGLVTPEFVDVGHALAGGDFEQAVNNLHLAAAPPINYGPSATNADNRIFDTWHNTYDHDADVINDPPPFKPANPVKAVQITIRFFDVSSGQTRQITIVEAMNF